MNTNYKYLLFRYHHHYPEGGMNDLLCKFNSINELKQELNEYSSEWWNYDYYHLVDTSNFEYWYYDQFCDYKSLPRDCENAKIKVIDWIENCLIENEEKNNGEDDDNYEW